MRDQRLKALHNDIDDIDKKIFELIAQRNQVSERIGLYKQDNGLPQRDYAYEKHVIDHAQSVATQHNLPHSLYHAIAISLVRSAISIEEKHAISSANQGNGRDILVIGAAGKMGGWMMRFLQSQGFGVVSADPSKLIEGVESYHAWQDMDDLNRFDAIIVAPPLRSTNDTLLELATRKPRGVVFDVGSLKTPLRTGIAALHKAGVPVTSIHPMFGPDVELLSGRHIIFIDCDDDHARRYAHELFRSTTAVQVDMTLDEHDQLIATVLGLSHATNIAFLDALVKSGQSAPRLAQMSSTTFDAQLKVANDVAHENPWLYYDIQALNEFGLQALDHLQDSIVHLRNVVATKDVDTFVSIMEIGRAYLDGRTPNRDVLKSG